MMHLCLIASLLLTGDAPKPADATPTQVLIVGTFHMSNPGRDLLNPSVKDVLGERRQKEILEVVARLEKFRPTKIALEVDPGPKMQQRLEKYLAGQHTLTTNEVDQLGLRLAKNLHLRTLYGIDFGEDLAIEQAFNYAEKNQQGDIVKSVMSELETKLKPSYSSEYMESHSIREILAHFNEPAMDDLGHGFYMKMLRIGKGKDYPGADVAAHWYHRNLLIATHIVRLADNPGERILVIIGSGHCKLLRQFIRETPGFELVDCMEYLK